MPDVNLPLSGAVSQVINPWTAYLTATGSQIGLININLGTSSNPDVEKQVISDVASYGKQLGRIGDVLLVLLRHLPSHEKLEAEDREAIADLKSMLHEIANVKARHEEASARRIPLRPEARLLRY